MDLYSFLSIIIICIAFIICFVINKFNDISKYNEYKSEYYAKLKEDRDIESIKGRYNVSIQKITEKINNLDCFNTTILEDYKTSQHRLYDITIITASGELTNTEKLKKIINTLTKTY